MKQSEIKFTVTLSENNAPAKIDWSASDVGMQSTSKAIMLSIWDEKEENTMRIDLWTKEMKIDEMKLFYHQTLVSMANTLERATGEKDEAQLMRDYAQQFAERMELETVEP